MLTHPDPFQKAGCVVFNDRSRKSKRQMFRLEGVNLGLILTLRK